MSRFSLLECTLRDGGYITNWNFENEMIKDVINSLSESGFDYIEVGYLNNKSNSDNTTQFRSVCQIEKFLPSKKQGMLFLAMADVLQFFPENITPFDGKSIDGIRVVFYKHQIEEALCLGKAISENGYKLFMQPMVTIDYTLDEYVDLAKKIVELNPFAVSIVDSFGYMQKSDFRKYFRILDNIFPDNVIIGFHSHNNMGLSYVTAQDILDYQTARNIIIDSSLYGMGRGAGNLPSELIAEYYNRVLGKKYDINIILDLISKYIIPIAAKRNWGYSPYFLITALYHCHPNYASYLLQEYDVSVTDFREYIEFVPREMYTKCQKSYVLETYEKYKKKRMNIGNKNLGGGSL
jgi:4-hydroxy 2-oxovalerate aldolase